LGRGIVQPFGFWFHLEPFPQVFCCTAERRQVT
jgi:hypothetical protein